MYYTYRSYCDASEHRGCNRSFFAEETHGCRGHFSFSVKLPYFIAESQSDDHQIPNRPHIFYKYFSTHNEALLLKYE
jgi:hypothetical protein